MRIGINKNINYIYFNEKIGLNYFMNFFKREIFYGFAKIYF